MTNSSSNRFFAYPEGDTERAAPEGFLAGMREDEIAIVLGYTQARRYDPGEVAVRRGDQDRTLYVITTGRFEVSVPAAKGPLRLSLLKRGDIFGELAFFDGESRSADVVALESAGALVLTTAGFERLRVAKPQLALRLALDLGRVLSGRLREMNRRAVATQSR